MNDLFSGLENSGRSPKMSAEFPDFFSDDLKGKGKSGSTGLSLPRRAGKSGGLPFSLAEGRQANRFGDLRATAIRLANEIEQVEEKAASLHAIQKPFEDAFWQAHRSLEDLYRFRLNGPEYPDRTTVLAAHDRRMHAGHQWYPHREPYKVVLRWLKALRTELKQVNSEIGT